jgi:hypothetical protein
MLNTGWQTDQSIKKLSTTSLNKNLGFTVTPAKVDNIN